MIESYRVRRFALSVALLMVAGVGWEHAPTAVGRQVLAFSAGRLLSICLWMYPA
jgi:hypothetical protein